MDEFAQTRAPDDLFDDDFTPIAESETHIPEPLQISRQSEPRHIQRNQQRQWAERREPLLRKDDDSSASISAAGPPQVPRIPSTEAKSGSIHGTDVPVIPDNGTPAAIDTSNKRSVSQHKPLNSNAVRGDRAATGGVAKPKLTEEELSAKLAAVKLNNAKISEAHRLAEADEASFQQREAKASQKRAEEGAARRAMNLEREKNRARKLGAQAGREWDEGKEAEAAERGSQYRRGAHGGVSTGRNNPQNESYNQSLDHVHGQRRGGRFQRGQFGRGERSRGRGRGERAGPEKSAHQAPPNPLIDFPALPTASRSWAEEMQDT